MNDDEQHPAEDHPGRGKNGKFIRTLETAKKDLLAAELRARGRAYWEIAIELGYSNASGASKAVARALAAVPAEGVAELRALECARLDELTRRLFAVLDIKYPLLAPGREFVDKDDRPIPDPRPILAVVDRLMRISERRAKLLGLDSAPKPETNDSTRISFELTDRHLELLRILLTDRSIEPADRPALLALSVAAEQPEQVT